MRTDQVKTCPEGNRMGQSGSGQVRTGKNRQTNIKTFEISLAFKTFFYFDLICFTLFYLFDFV